MMKTNLKKRILKTTILSLLFSVTALAGNQLSTVRTTTNSLEVQLSNSEDVAGIQFSLHTSSDVILGQIERYNRTSESHWIVSSYKPNDSTVNVVILSFDRKVFTSGSGSIVKISFSQMSQTEKSYARLTNVMVTNSKADSLGIGLRNLEWNNTSIFASTNEEKTFVLGQNFPNPFNPSTQIAYRLNKAAQVRLSIYDITGREVNRLVDQYQYVGEYKVEWNSNSTTGQTLASGMYIARLTVDNESVSRKMIMAK
jgi:hypothetical protein